MVEKLLEESETLLLDTPYLRRMRETARQEGVQIGRQEGVQIGRQEGVQLGREKGREQGLREAILEVVIRKFNPPAADYRQLQQDLEQIHLSDTLQEILLTLFDAPDVDIVLNLARQTAVSQ